MPIGEVWGEAIGEFEGLGLLETDGEWVRLSRRGRLLGNEVFERFV
jgi:coproporphyrinogen III oxidase-like Fe-S oxidoreductase